MLERSEEHWVHDILVASGELLPADVESWRIRGHGRQSKTLPAVAAGVADAEGSDQLACSSGSDPQLEAGCSSIVLAQFDMAHVQKAIQWAIGVDDPVVVNHVMQTLPDFCIKEWLAKYDAREKPKKQCEGVRPIVDVRKLSCRMRVASMYDKYCSGATKQMACRKLQVRRKNKCPAC